MAGARPSGFKKGGGFLNNVDAVWTSYRFTDDFNGEPFKDGKITFTDKSGQKKTMDKPHSLNAYLGFTLDGAEDEVFTTLKVAGDFDEWEVSEDEQTIAPVDGEKGLSANSAFSKFIYSLCNPTDETEGFPEDRLPEDAINYSACLGTRMRLVQRADAERTKEFGKKKTKQGKEFDRTDLLVETIYELPAVGGKVKGKATPVVKGKGKPTPQAPDLSDIATDALRQVIEANGGSIQKSRLRVKLLTLLKDEDQRDEVIKLIYDDKFLAAVDGVAYDKAKGTLDAVAA